jgi:hypothetical protein
MTAADRKNMPLYRCHKLVRALEIAEITQGPRTGELTFRIADAGFAPVTVERGMTARYFPVPGDFYVVYEPDGYESISPRKAFLDGYTLITPWDRPIDDNVLVIDQDAATDCVTIDGVRYARLLFRELGDALPLDTPFALTKREDGVLSIRRLAPT